MNCTELVGANCTELVATATQIDHILTPLKTLIEIIVIAIAGCWAFYKFLEFREFKHWVQFEVDANIYPMSDCIKAKSYNWNRKGVIKESDETYTHLLEILFKFNNKGKTRVKIYNIQAEFSTLPPLEYVFCWYKLKEDEERLKDFLAQKFNIDWVRNAIVNRDENLKKITLLTEKNCLTLTEREEKLILKIDDGREKEFFIIEDECREAEKCLQKGNCRNVKNNCTREGNYKKKGIYYMDDKASIPSSDGISEEYCTHSTKSSYVMLDKEDGHLSLYKQRTGNIVPKEKRFYYIEPQVEQTITYLTLIKKPKDIIRIKGNFCQDDVRIYPSQETSQKQFCDDKKFIFSRFGKWNWKILHYKCKLFSYICKFFRCKRRWFLFGFLFNKIYENFCMRLLSHTSERTYYLDRDGFIKK